MSRIALIAAVAMNGTIGYKGTIPWHYREDLEFFKIQTFGNPCIMGRKTYESIGKALPGRRCVVVSNELESLPDAEVVKSLTEAVELVEGASDVFIIGGERLYREGMDIANELVITALYESHEGDAFFPDFNRGKLTPEWSLNWVKQSTTGSFEFRKYIRKT